MRYLILLALLLATPANAAGPDGPAGTVWLDLDAVTMIDGEWTGTRPMSPVVTQEIGGKRLAGTVGVVLGSRVSLRLAGGYGTSTLEQFLGRGPGDPTVGWDVKVSSYQFGLGLRVYLNLPK